MFESVHYDAKRAKKRQIRDIDERLIETYTVVEGTEVRSSSIVYKPFDLPGILCDADLNPTEIFYDTLGRKQREEDPTTGTTRLYYNGLGELRREERGPGTGTADAIVYHHDKLGRVQTMDTADGTVRPSLPAQRPSASTTSLSGHASTPTAAPGLARGSSRGSASLGSSMTTRGSSTWAVASMIRRSGGS